jgi:ABC-type amino acid transport substrate-binding protein
MVNKIKGSFFRGQGIIEYLVIISIVVVIAFVVVGLMNNSVSSSVSVSNSASEIGSKSSLISISNAVVDRDGNGLISLQNVSGETISITKISVEGHDLNYSTTMFQGDNKIFSLTDLNSYCTCVEGPGSKRKCDYSVYFQSEGGLEKRHDYSLTVECVSDAEGVYLTQQPIIAPDFPLGKVPSDLNAVALSTSRIDLSWVDRSDNETGFIIDRSLDGSTWGQIATVAADVNTYSSTGLTESTLYYYRVKAYKNDKNSDYTNTANATTQARVLEFESIWAKSEDNSVANSDTYGYSVAVDLSGNVYVAGNYSGDLNVGGVILPDYAGYDFFVVKYDSSGAVVWAKSEDNSVANSDTYGYSVAVDLSGNVYVAGFYSGDLNVGGVILPDYAGDDFFVVKYDSSGAVVWAKSNSNSAANNYDRAYSVAVDLSGNVYVAGYRSGDLNVGGIILPNYSSDDFFVVKYDSGGGVVWAKSNNNSMANMIDAARYVAVDLSGNVYVAGSYSGDLNVGGVILPDYAGNDFFVVKYDSSGGVVWAKSNSNSAANSDVYDYSVAVDLSGNVYATGYYTGDLNVGGIILPNYASQDFFVAKYGYR